MDVSYGFANKQVWNKVARAGEKGLNIFYSQMNTIFEEYGVKAIGEVEKLSTPIFISLRGGGNR